MKKNLIRLLPLVLLVAGCTREIVDPLAENRGLTVDFQLSTYYTQGTLLTKAPDELFDSSVTKTVFSGKDEGGQDVTSASQKERIDWKAGDKVDVMIRKDGTSDTRVYEIKGFTADGNLKSKSTSVSSANPFTFKGGGSYYFFATYPSLSTGKAIRSNYGLWSPSETTAGFGLYMPENLACSIVDKGDSYVVMDDMDYAVMTAGKSVNLSSPQAIELDFKPFFNAYQLLLINTETTRNYKLETLTITCTSGFLRTKADVANRLPSLISADGTMSWNNYTPETDRCIRSFTYNFKQLSGYSEGIPFNKPLDITLLALPIAQSGISITFTFSGGITRTLTLDPSVTLAPSHKLRIYNIGEEVEYELGNLQDILLAYNESGNRQVSATDKFVSRKKSKSSASTWQPTPYTLEYYDEASGSWRNLNENPRGGNNPFNGLLSGITAGYTGSTTGERLSLNLRQNTAQSHVTSANSHQELAQDWRSKTDFDLSTYNVATGATVATSTANCYVVSGYGTYKFPLVYGNALKNGSFNSGCIAPEFLDHRGVSFGNDAYINRELSNLSAQVLWTDVSGLITEVGISGDYLHFTVPKDKIKQGNALIAVFSGANIAWSWHIWVTDVDLRVQENASNGYRLATANLGWCADEGDYSATTWYLARSFKIRACQTESGLVSEAFVVQRGYSESAATNHPGNNLFYQWGRKDPMQGNKTYYGSYAFTRVASRASLAEAIKNPHKFYTENRNAGSRWCDSQYNNLWDVNGQKTIYDPCPVGYRVPPRGALDTFRCPENFSYVRRGSWGYYTLSSLKFPATGARQHDSGSIYAHGSGGNYWTSQAHRNLVYQALSMGFVWQEPYGTRVNFYYPSDADGYYARAGGCSIRPTLE